MVSVSFRHSSRPSRHSPTLYISEICEALAKSIMPITCLSSLYDPLQGFGDNAQLARDIVKAFEQSPVSLEVKGGALRAAKEIYDLD